MARMAHPTDPQPEPDDPALRAEIRACLALSPAERLAQALAATRGRGRPGAAEFDPLRILAVLHRHGVPFVVTGQVAGILHGSPRVTFDVDLAYQRSPDACARLSAALRELRARPLGAAPGAPFALSAEHLAERDHVDLTTAAGDLDCTDFGASYSRELWRRASRLELAGRPLAVAALADLLRMKRRAGRPQDARDLVLLAAVADETDRDRPHPPPRVDGGSAVTPRPRPTSRQDGHPRGFDPPRRGGADARR
jgi:hypothetical protein